MAQSGIKQSTGLLNLTTNGVKLRACAKQIFYFPTSADFPSYAVEAYLLSMDVVRFVLSLCPCVYGAQTELQSRKIFWESE